MPKTRRPGHRTKERGAAKRSKRTRELPIFDVGWLPVPAGKLTPAAARRWLSHEFPRLQDLVMEVTKHARPEETESASMLAFHVKDMVEACAKAIDSGRPVEIGTEYELPPDGVCPIWGVVADVANVLRIAARIDGDGFQYVAGVVEGLADALHDCAKRADGQRDAVHARKELSRDELAERIQAFRADAEKLDRQADAHEEELLERVRPIVRETTALQRTAARIARGEAADLEHKHFSGPDPGKPPEGYQPRGAA